MSKILDWLGNTGYPDGPGFKAAGPSQEAAEAFAPQACSLREQVLEIIKRSGGLTADEVARELGRSILAVRPRVSELRRLGEIRQNGQRGLNRSGMSAAVWVASPNLGGRE